MDITVHYFDRPGKGNTRPTLDAVRQRAVELGIRQVVVATTHGYTALETRQALSDPEVKIIAVSICAAFDDEGWTMTAEERCTLESAGVEVLTSMHSLGDDVNEAFQGDAPNMVVRRTLYTFGQGMKVAVECALMAADAGLLAMDQDVISVAGTGEGADTAILAKPVYAKDFPKLRIREILAKPRL